LSNNIDSLCYVVKDLNLENRSGRIDAHFFDPRYFEMVNNLVNMGRKTGLKLWKLNGLLMPSKTNLTGGATPKGAVYLEEGIRFIRVQNVKESKIKIENAVFIERRIHDRQLRRSKLKPNDIVMTITGSYGIASVVPEDIGEANINQHIVKIESNNELVDVHYLSHFLNSQLCKTQIDRVATGSTRLALSYPAIKSLLILLPENIELQKEIAKQIDEIYQKAYDKLKERDKLLSTVDDVIIKKLDIKLPNEYSKTCFIEDVNGINRFDALSKSPYLHALRESIKKIPHEKLVELVVFKEKEAPAFNDYYRLVDLRNIEEKIGRVKVIEVDSLGSGKIKLHKGDICINCLNPEKAKTIYITQELDGCVGSTEFTPIEPLLDKINPAYLVVILRSKIVVDQWKYQITGSTPSRERIGDEELRETLIPKPEKDIQKEIAESVLGIIDKVAYLEQESKREIEHAKHKFLEYLNQVSTPSPDN